MHKLNCKTGDLAIVVSAELQENLGQIVEVLGIQTGRPFPLLLGGHMWQVRAVSGRTTLSYRIGRPGVIERYNEGPAPDFSLRPISGLADADSGVEHIEAVGS